MEFIGRKEELGVLEREYGRAGGFVVVYGRRRVGKTTLIKQFIRSKNALYFLAGEEPDRQNLNKFTAKVAEFTGQAYLSEARFDSWQRIFSVLVDNNPGSKKVLVIDEFQYLVQSNAAFPSIFQEVWDEILKDRNVMVILCGSHISMMESVALNHSSPLYGRRTAQIRLHPLKFVEFSGAFAGKSFEERAKIYSVTGGVPKYVEFFDNDLSLEENIIINILNKSGFLYEEPAFLLEKEVREPVNYFSIMKAISMGNHKISEIATVLEQKASSLSPYLAILSSLFLIEKRMPVTEKAPEKSRRGLYYICDNFIEFWFRFVFPYKGELELDNYGYVLEKLNSNLVDNHVSFVYEQICREVFVLLCREGQIDFNISKIGAFWNSSIQIDIVAIDHQHQRLFAGECKFYEKPVVMRVYSDLLEKCRNIPEFEGYSIIYGLFSKSGFDDRLVEISRENEALILINEEAVMK
ncbi:MAG TPA: ATP-binding protein [Clostridiales bacterium]|nr:ATP-binding protein [Clostridiales bacterium]